MGIKNVLICGYVKSGTTWLTRLCAQLIECPAAGYWGSDSESLETEGLERVSEYSCYKSHHLYPELTTVSSLPIEKVIYIIRDPRDVLISAVFHFNFYPVSYEKLAKSRLPGMKALSKYLKLTSTKLTPFKRKAERMTEALINGDDFFPYMSQSWTGHVKSYLDHEVLFIRYEDLLNSGLQTAKQILSFLGIEKSDEAIMRDFQAQSFETRKTEFDNSKEIERSNHLRQGKSASWKMYLTDTQNEIFYAHFQELMISFNYEL